MRTATIDRSREWTVEDYLQLGEMDTPCQLINGELFMSPAPTPYHQKISKLLFKILDRAAAQAGGEIYYAPLDVFIDPKNVLQPDLLFIAESQLKNISKRGMEGAPKLVVEIISPSNIFVDRNIKRKKYIDAGVAELWIVDPANQTLEIYLQQQTDLDTPHLYLAGEGTVTSTVLTSINFDLKTIF
jgi:Uma2 family endonuclease